MGILKLIFRKKTLTTILYVIVIAIIREATAIGVDEGYQELVNKVVEYYNNQSVVIGGLLILLIYTKGSYITLGILIGLFLLIRDLLKVEITNSKQKFPYLDLYIDRTSQHPDQYNDGVSLIGQGQTYTQPGDVPYKFRWKWNFIFKIVNNSDHTAYNVKYEFEKDKNLFEYLKKLPNPTSITGNNNVELSGYKTISKEMAGKDATKYRKGHLPPDTDFNDYKVLISYQNSDRVKFYTLYSQKDNKKHNEHFRYKPEPFAKYTFFQKLRIKINE